MGPDINFYTRKWVRPEDLNAHGTLFGGSLLRWIDDEAVVYAAIQLGTLNVVTKYISEIDFVSSAHLGDIIEIGLVATSFGRTSITMRAEVRNIVSGRSILTIERVVFVALDAAGLPLVHGYGSLTRSRERLAAGAGVAEAEAAG
jgi:acyl-CoA thioesterase YciA